ncbi:uncharacterized protein THITE_2118698 [Thermothielavioides terrestris NRRL 8126]|uniref:Uncharacterized protein n=1 Tax=Thermothielavioides terrestris (strain ATCC 38088 / NRRL 8126) TaxID=578455 RepID=G2RAM4_THETT|nr:uncharacterized protein THITE_2118698 [Thermothielavioides terrestris NRRL 8126]AEO68902.1 hypothetical protein THITE_2118698 [Thermothielavioides terrestris NRRL 8126]
MRTPSTTASAAFSILVFGCGLVNVVPRLVITKSRCSRFILSAAPVRRSQRDSGSESGHRCRR